MQIPDLQSILIMREQLEHRRAPHYTEINSYRPGFTKTAAEQCSYRAADQNLINNSLVSHLFDHQPAGVRLKS